MRIGMVLAAGYYPPDIRVDKEAKALEAKGHLVFVLCSGHKSEKVSDRIEDRNIFVERMEYPRSVLKLGNLIHGLTSFKYHPIWRWRIKHFALKNDIDVLHVHDLLPALVTGSVAKELEIPMVVDLHEDYFTQRQGITGLSTRVFATPKRIDKAQHRAIDMADRVIVTCPRYPDVYEERYGDLNTDKFICVPNFQDLESIESFPERGSSYAEESSFELVFVGGMGSVGRGVQVAIEAMPYLLKRIPQAKLVLVGNGAYVSVLKNRVSELGLENAVEFTGYLDFHEALKRMASSTIGIVPLIKDYLQYNYCCPHKLFQYMVFKMPVLVSDCYEISRHVVDSGAGLVFRSGDPEDFAEKAVVLQSKELQSEMGERGYRAVIENLNFEKGASGLFQYYESLTDCT
ncbi:MAG: glycosyltransferase family 4 protein [Actinobacteria bacterium]|nr:glycosyltransferase family 4 protein [Actinomycetota bacterium]